METLDRRKSVKPGWQRALKSLQTLLLSGLLVLAIAVPARAAQKIDPDVQRYLISDGVATVKYDDSGATADYSAVELTRGRDVFMENCAYCHANGLTLPYPEVSLTVEDLAGATPPRDNVTAFVDYLRYPMTYDGSEETFWCREVPESWLARDQVEELAAFALRSADVVPGWGELPRDPLTGR